VHGAIGRQAIPFQENTAFDAILGFILASMLARAVNGSAAFFPTLAGGFVLIALHRIIAFLARHSHRFGNLVKGKSEPVIKNGKLEEKTMAENDLTKSDLLEDMRLNGRTEDFGEVKSAYFERNGEVSVVLQKE